MERKPYDKSSLRIGTVQAETGLVEDAIVTAYTDEGHDYDAPIFE